MIGRSWLLVGWLCAMAGSTLPALWSTVQRIEANPLGKYVDPITGAWTAQVYWHFLGWWLPIGIPVGLLAGACMVLNWPADKR
jgi:hypothetical protein